MADSKRLREQIIGIGERLYRYRLATARGGNLSARVEGDVVLMTRNGACLGELCAEDILELDLGAGAVDDMDGLSTEFPLHRLIYRSFPTRGVV
ncbi:MAG: class II aldolase/adducin family protein, partial [Planctomycetota bacterium]